MLTLDRRKYAPEGDNGPAGSGGSDNPNPAIPRGEGSDSSKPTSSGNSDFVKREVFENYKKDLFKAKDKNKALNEELARYRSEENSRAEEKLLEEKRFQELLEKRDAEIAELRGQSQGYQETISNYEKREITGQKLNAFLDAADFKIDSKYLSFIDIDGIQVGDDGKVVASTVTDAIEKMRKEHPALITGKSKSPSHHQPGNNASNKITKAQHFELMRKDPNAAYRAVYEGRVLDT